MNFLCGRRVLVTGGFGIVPRSATCDLRDREAVRRLYQTERPEVVTHLAAVVGGIGANRRNPGLYFHDNAIMGIQLMDEAHRAGVERHHALARQPLRPIRQLRPGIELRHPGLDPQSNRGPQRPARLH